MDNLQNYIKNFFSLLNIDSDTENRHFFKDYIFSAIMEFLDDEIKKEAYDVYSLFLDIYRVNISGDKSFIDLLDVLKSYEENAAVLNDKQRDHYIHSLNVFLLGLSIYAENSSYRNTFSSYINKRNSGRHFKTIHEEFFFRWGLASLFHDIGYPVEIISNQFNKFIAYVSGGNEKGNAEAKPFLSYFNFEIINSIDSYDDDKFIKPEDYKKAAGNVNPERLTEILAFEISRNFSVPLDMVKKTTDGFLEVMQKYQFVDHGFYSALIVLKWFGELMQKKPFPDVLLFDHVIDAASAIFMHNAYKNIFLKSPYELGRMNPAVHPVSFLLILCDESQEWNREAYGIKTREMISVDDSKVSISDDTFRLHYITKNGVVGSDFIKEKVRTINMMLDTESLFGNGIKVTATTLTEQFIATLVEKRDMMLPRILIEHIELIAKKIHEKYNEKQLERNPDRPLANPTWESLPDTLKYSNVRQAKDMVSKLKQIGCYIAEFSDGILVESLTDEETEYLAEIEHKHWTEERFNTGWVLGEEKSTGLKTSPYLIPYDELPEEIKEYDRDAVRSIIPLLKSVNISVYRQAL